METNKTIRIAKNEVKAKLEVGIEVLYKNKFRVDKIEQFEGEEKLFLTFLETKSESVISFERCEGYFYVKPVKKQLSDIQKADQMNPSGAIKPAKVKAPEIDKSTIISRFEAEEFVDIRSVLDEIKFANGYHSMVFDLKIKSSVLNVDRKIIIPLNYMEDFDIFGVTGTDAPKTEQKAVAKAFITGNESKIKAIYDAKGQLPILINRGMRFANGYHSLVFVVALAVIADEGKILVQKEVLIPLSYTKDFN